MEDVKVEIGIEDLYKLANLAREIINPVVEFNNDNNKMAIQAIDRSRERAKIMLSMIDKITG